MSNYNSVRYSANTNTNTNTNTRTNTKTKQIMVNRNSSCNSFIVTTHVTNTKPVSSNVINNPIDDGDDDNNLSVSDHDDDSGNYHGDDDQSQVTADEVQTNVIWHDVVLDKETLNCFVTKITTPDSQHPFCFLVIYTSHESVFMIEKLQAVYNRYKNVVGKKTFKNLSRSPGLLKPWKPDGKAPGQYQNFDYRLTLKINHDDKIFLDGKYKDVTAENMVSDKLFMSSITFALGIEFDQEKREDHNLTLLTSNVRVGNARYFCPRQ